MKDLKTQAFRWSDRVWVVRGFSIKLIPGTHTFVCHSRVCLVWYACRHSLCVFVACKPKWKAFNRRVSPRSGQMCSVRSKGAPSPNVCFMIRGEANLVPHKASATCSVAVIAGRDNEKTRLEWNLFIHATQHHQTWHDAALAAPPCAL